MLDRQYDLTTATVSAASGLETIGIKKSILLANIQADSGFGMRFYKHLGNYVNLTF